MSYRFFRGRVRPSEEEVKVNSFCSWTGVTWTLKNSAGWTTTTSTCEITNTEKSDELRKITEDIMRKLLLVLAARVLFRISHTIMAMSVYDLKEVQIRETPDSNLAG